MGKGKITFSKRRNGIVKEAKEISILCDAEVSLVILDSKHKISEFHSLDLIHSLKCFQRKCPDRRLWSTEHECMYQEIQRIGNENKSMKIELKNLKGRGINLLQPKKLFSIEHALDNGLTKVHAKLDDMPRIMNEKGRLIEEENKLLALKLQEKNGNARDVEEDFVGGEIKIEAMFGVAAVQGRTVADFHSSKWKEKEALGFIIKPKEVEATGGGSNWWLQGRRKEEIWEDEKQTVDEEADEKQTAWESVGVIVLGKKKLQEVDDHLKNLIRDGGAAFDGGGEARKLPVSDWWWWCNGFDDVWRRRKTMTWLAFQNSNLQMEKLAGNGVVGKIQNLNFQLVFWEVLSLLSLCQVVLVCAHECFGGVYPTVGFLDGLGLSEVFSTGS